MGEAPCLTAEGPDKFGFESVYSNLALFGGGSGLIDSNGVIGSSA